MRRARSEASPDVTVRLTDPQLAALDDVLPFRVSRRARSERTRVFIESLEFALGEYQFYVTLQRGPTVRDLEVARAALTSFDTAIRALRAALRASPPHPDGDLVEATLLALREEAARQLVVLERWKSLYTVPHRQADHYVAELGAWVAGALRAADVPLTVGRSTALVDVLRLVLSWADDLVGRPPRLRATSAVYAHAKAAIVGHRAFFK